MLDLIAAAVIASVPPQELLLSFDVKTTAAGKPWTARPRVATHSGTAAEVKIGTDAAAGALDLKVLPLYEPATNTIKFTLDFVLDEGGHHAKQHVEARVAEGSDFVVELDDTTRLTMHAGLRR